MAEPSGKSKLIEELLENMGGRTTAIQAGRCINPPFGCGKPVTADMSPIEQREWTISGMCGVCQRRVFTPREEEE